MSAIQRAIFTVCALLSTMFLVAAMAFALTGSRARSGAAPLTRVPAARAYHPALEHNGDPKLVHYRAGAAPVNPPHGALPAVLYAVPNGSDVVTPAIARSVTAAVWSLRVTAVATQDRAKLATIETGSALQIDAARGCGCGQDDRFGPANNTHVAVDHDRTFPASFSADTETTLNNTPWDALLVFTRSSRDEPWRLAFAGGGQPLAGPNSLLPFPVGPDGYVSDPTPAALASAAPLAPALAMYWQDAKDAKVPATSPIWDPGTLTDKWAEQIAANRQGKANLSNNLTGYYRYAEAPGTKTYVVPLGDDEFLACASIVGQSTFVAPAKTHVVQSADREEWGADVPPGSYRAVIEIDMYTPCFTFAPNATDVAVAGVTPPDTVTSIAVP